MNKFQWSIVVLWAAFTVWKPIIGFVVLTVFVVGVMSRGRENQKKRTDPIGDMRMPEDRE